MSMQINKEKGIIVWNRLNVEMVILRMVRMVSGFLNGLLMNPMAC